MKFVPHDYQKHAIDYVQNHPIAAVLLDMGLGKTVITLTALQNLLFDSFEVHKVLVIAPLRVATYNWPEEIKKWDHLSGLEYSVAVGTEEQRRQALMKQADIYLINRENVSWLIEDSGVPFDFDMIVVDELSSFKNPRTKRFKALMRVRPKVNRVVGLTGTPSPNGLMDLWAEFYLLDMGKRLGYYMKNYIDEYFLPNQRNGYRIFNYRPRAYAEKQIYKKIADITISMKSVDYLRMPELISREYKVHLSRTERKQYDDFRGRLVLTLAEGEVTASNATVLCNKLSQLANGAIYADDGTTIRIHDKKLDALEDIIEAANGKPVLVAYWFKHDLARIIERLQKLKVTYGEISSVTKIRQWNSHKLQVGLIHPASAGHGLNLQDGGSNLVWFGPTWSLELYLQTVARLWRQGQTADMVVVQHIIAADTIDERMMLALKEKEYTQESLIEAVKAEVKRNV